MKNRIVALLGVLLLSTLISQPTTLLAADDFITIQGGQATQSGTGVPARLETTSTGTGANKTHKLKTDGGAGGGSGGDASAANQATQITAEQAIRAAAEAILAKIIAAPASETTSAAILAKIIAAPATEAKQPGLGTALAPSANVITTQRPAITQVVSTAFEASHILKASAGQLVQLSVYNSGPAQFLLLINSATLPSDGAVTLLYPPIPIAAGSLLVLDLPAPLVASTGMVVCNSSTGTFTKTIGSADIAIYAQVN